jgi:hypothetical protein
MIQFHRNEIDEEWWDLVNEFPHIFLEPSPEVLSLYEEYKDAEYSGFPNNKEDLCNLRFGFECNIKWKEIIREFCLEMDEIHRKAKENGDEAFYCTFILKEKFGTCRDQGTMFGKDKTKYYKDWSEASHRLYEKSTKIK